VTPATRPKDIGTRGETAVVNFLRENGFPHAERRALAGSLDLGDILVTAGVIAEVKAGVAAETASDGQVVEWLAETERERVHANAAVGLLVTKRRGKGHGNAGQWWAHLRLGDLRALLAGIGDLGRAEARIAVRLTLADAVRLLRSAGYGEPLP